MIVRKNLKFKLLFANGWKPILIYMLIGSIPFFTYDILKYEQFRLPLAVSATLGTALAIILGFRNNAAYDRWWEARKIWGGIVNTSRILARQVLTLGTLQHTNGRVKEAELKQIQQRIIYRHLAWINALRLQLRKQDNWEKQVRPFLDIKEFNWLIMVQNKATQLIQKQGEEIREAHFKGVFEDFRHMQLDNTLNTLYELQGKAERIKNTPLARQYNFFPKIFMWLFIFLLPFGLIEPLTNQTISWMIIPLNGAIGYVFYVIMKIGEFNEDPFENRVTDTPLTALCRTIEIDLREQLGEKDLPPKLEPRDGFLM